MDPGTMKNSGFTSQTPTAHSLKHLDTRAAHWSPSHFVTVLDPHHNAVGVNFTLPPADLNLTTFDLTLFRIDPTVMASPDRETRLDHVTYDSRNASNITFANLEPGTYHVSLHPFENDDDGNCICIMDYNQCSCSIKDSQEFIVPDVANPASWWGAHQIVEVVDFMPPSSRTNPSNGSANKPSLAVRLHNVRTKPWAPFERFDINLFKTTQNATSKSWSTFNRTLTDNDTTVHGKTYANNSGTSVMLRDTLITKEQIHAVQGEDLIHMFNDLEPGAYYAEITPVESKYHCFCYMKHTKTCVQCQPARSPIIHIPTHALMDKLAHIEMQRHNLTTLIENQGPILNTVGQKVAPISPGLTAALLPLALVLMLLAIMATIIYLKMRPFRRKKCIKKFGNLFTHSTISFKEISDRKSYAFSAVPTVPSSHYPLLKTTSSKDNNSGGEESKPLVLLVYANDDATHAYAVDRLAAFLTARCGVTVAYDKAVGHELASGRWEWIQHNLNACDRVLLINSPSVLRHYASRLAATPQNDEPKPWFAPGAPEVLTVARQIVDATLDRYWLCSGDNYHDPPHSSFKSKLLSCRFDYTDPACVLPLLSPGYVYRLMGNLEELLTTVHGLDPKRKHVHFGCDNNCVTAPTFAFTQSDWATCGGPEAEQLWNAMLMCADPSVSLKLGPPFKNSTSSYDVRLTEPDSEEAVIVGKHTSLKDLNIELRPDNGLPKPRDKILWKNYDSVTSLPLIESSKMTYELPDISFSLTPPISHLYAHT